jgi:hypothetical protein
VPYVVGRPLGEAGTAMRLAGLSGVAVEQDPQPAGAVVVSQEHPLTVAIIMPTTVELRVWLETGPGRRVPVLGGGSAPSGCRPVNRQSRCLVRLDALTAEEPRVWTVGLAKLSIQPASVRSPSRSPDASRGSRFDPRCHRSRRPGPAAG